ncbi:protein ENHANCED DISEASE RESISTANCE 4 [Trifolium pratense]|uniref:protein ENHANCED DISEASE RESISTANCE 4 n=1 Tax=Trifolium pratense TaxID=57577 RepID=UPI001E691E26|nr:protein ENHANCED DISEASE RESISTANCE 4 [Trifolium pratense]XP_045828337.1 protein ENHANCED DISEASE RESISTANCE 4 [Trifolium pratense]XP_045828338.1 protein ENHANCED DISEASE RESISTANCE 4 [Trifolium pratense]XP_045828339.1 protein ENHANCED DISEASE RESISTANCE 4 [Trifolium pratense]
MSSEPAPKPRFVLCPKCWQLLQESPNFELYKCGGCGTTLQAKKRKSTTVNSESSSHEADTAPRNALDCSPQQTVLRGKATSSSSADCSSEGNEGKDQIENSECNVEKPVTTQDNGLREKATFSASSECSLEVNIERAQLENGGCNEEKPITSQENGLREKRTSSSSEECSLDRNGETAQIGNGECNEERPAIYQDNGLREKATSSSGEYSSDGNGGRGQIENGECDEEHLGPFNSSSNEELKDAMDIYKLSDIRRHTVSNKGCSNETSAELVADNSVEKVNETNLKVKEEPSNGNMPLERAENQLINALDREDASDDKTAIVGVKSDVAIGTNDLEVAAELNNGILSQEGAGQKLTSGSDGDCVDNDKLALVDESSATDVNGTDKEDSKELNNGNLLSTAERSSTVDFMSKKGSISYVSPRELKEDTCHNHASLSENIPRSFERVRSADTFDNTDVNNLSLEITGALEEVSKSPTTRSSHAYDGSVSSNDGIDEQFLGQNLYSFEGVSRKGKGVVNSMLYEDVETQHQSNFPNRNCQNEVLETTRLDHAHRMRTKKDEFPFKMPLHGSGSQSGYESGSPANQIYDELYLNSSYVSPDSVEDPDQEKMKLLRMVYKLQDQLNRTNLANREINERPSAVNHISSFQSHDFHEGRFYHGLDYSRGDANASYSHGINMHQRRHNLSRIPSGNAHHVDHPCFDCFPQEWQRSGEFPPQFPYQREDLYRRHPGHTRCLSHQSYPSSPQWLMPSKHVHSRETKSCDQRHMAPEMNYTRDKPSLSKRHYRPVAGGAPFITCHKCLKLLQLPADFLLFKRVCHKLKCGACQEVLKFSLQNSSHIVSYTPNVVGPLSSGPDLQNKLINGIIPHAADPVSYSDDYGHSVSKSYSSEGDHVSVAPFHHLHSGARDNPSVSPVTVEGITNKEKIASRGPSTSRAPTNMSSERKETQSQEKASALHQLMGYSSPSQVIRGAPSSAEGKEAMLNGKY